MNVAGDWTGHIPFVSVSKTERSNWDATRERGEEGGREEEARSKEREIKVKLAMYL